MTFILVELEKFHKNPENCITDLDKLIFTMKEAHKAAQGGEQPEFMKEDWIASALHELDTRGMSPERRAHLSIAVARELSERHRVEQAFIEAEAAENNAKKAIAEAKAAKKEAIAAKAEAKAAKADARSAKTEANKAKVETEKQLIKNLILNLDWSDQQIIENLQLPLTLIKQVRLELQGKK